MISWTHYAKSRLSDNDIVVDHEDAVQQLTRAETRHLG